MAMKKGDKFQFSYDWWNKGKPKALLPTGLGEALKKYEAAKQTFQQETTKAAYERALAVLAEVDKAREKAVKLCLASFPTEKVILQAGDKEIEAEKRRLEEYGRAKLAAVIGKRKPAFETARGNVERLVATAPGLTKRLDAMAAQPGRDDDQRDAAQKLIESAVEVVTAIKRQSSYCHGYRQGYGMSDVIFFKADPAFAATVAETLKAAPAALRAVKELQDAIADAAEAWNIEVEYPHVT